MLFFNKTDFVFWRFWRILYYIFFAKDTRNGCLRQLPVHRQYFSYKILKLILYHVHFTNIFEQFNRFFALIFCTTALAFSVPNHESSVNSRNPWWFGVAYVRSKLVRNHKNKSKSTKIANKKSAFGRKLINSNPSYFGAVLFETLPYAYDNND